MNRDARRAIREKVPMLQLVIGNRNYSSWSLRAWLVLAQTGAEFEEILIPLDQPDTAAKIRTHSPSGRIPCLIDGGLAVWDSLAINETLNERYPAAQLWPKDPVARAIARSVSAEMHAGFIAVRTAMSMDISRTHPTPPMTAQLAQEIARVKELWTDCRQRFGQGGPFLFGAFTIADAMWAPVVTRFRSYGVPLEGVCASYAEAIWNHPPMKRWVEGALEEPWELPGH